MAIRGIIYESYSTNRPQTDRLKKADRQTDAINTFEPRWQDIIILNPIILIRQCCVNYITYILRTKVKFEIFKK